MNYNNFGEGFIQSLGAQTGSFVGEVGQNVAQKILKGIFGEPGEKPLSSEISASENNAISLLNARMRLDREILKYEFRNQQFDREKKDALIKGIGIGVAIGGVIVYFALKPIFKRHPERTRRVLR